MSSATDDKLPNAMATDTKGLARALGIGLSTAKQLVATGRIHSVRAGKRRVIPLAAIEEYLRGSGQ